MSAIIVMIRVENKKIIEGLPHSFKDCFQELRSTNNSTVLKQENNRIIKLIRQKKYPLHSSNKSALIFPKLKENYPLRKEQLNGNLKKYIEVNLEDERTNPHARVRTDIEEELIQKYQLNLLKKNSDYETSEFNHYTKLVKHKKNCQSFKRKTLQDQCTQPSAPYRHSSHIEISPKQLANIESDSIQNSIIAQQSRFHCELMASIKNRLQQRKQDFLRKLNLTQMISCSNEKQHCNIEYIVSSLQQREKQLGKGSTSAYERLYPNHLGNYLKILNKKEKKLNIWEQFEKAELLKEKINEQELKSMHLMQNAHKRNIAVVEDENEFQQEHLLSAKYRMKSNHRKLIEISKARTKN